MSGLFAGTQWERPVTCEQCGRAVDQCECPPAPEAQATLPPAQQAPRVRRERRRGKWCTVVAGLQAADLKPLLKSLRSELGCGGGTSDGEMVLQGDRREEVVARLRALGYQAKSAGG
ncbi:MAG: translation initiation factor [Planctomycetaceae bacterium]|nr:translation initiation factor [Planctomycetaceae bacterium]